LHLSLKHGNDQRSCFQACSCIGLLASGLFYFQHFRLRSWGDRHIRFENQLLGLCIAGLIYGGMAFLAAIVSQSDEIETSPGVHHVQFSLLHLFPAWWIISIFGPFFAIVPGCLIKLLDRFILRNHLKNLPSRLEGTIVGVLSGAGAGIGLHILFIPWTIATSCYLVLLPVIIGGTSCYMFCGVPNPER
jgi:hypothetical protein